MELTPDYSIEEWVEDLEHCDRMMRSHLRNALKWSERAKTGIEQIAQGDPEKFDALLRQHDPVKIIAKLNWVLTSQI